MPWSHDYGSTAPTLNWAGSDEEDGTNLDFRVYVWNADSTMPTVPTRDWESGTDISITGLESGKIYQWRVDTKDSHGGTSEGNTWQFFTP